MNRPSVRLFVRILPLFLALAGVGRIRAAEEDKDKTPPPPKFEFGFEERIRSENWDNLVDWNSESADTVRQVRFRSRLWAGVPLGRKVSFYVCLNNETRKISKPDTAFHFDEIIFEQCYVDVAFNRTVSLRAGRQNLTRGEGFILADGNPGDGSRSYYFNALDAALTLPGGKLELLAICDPYRDIYLPQFHDRNRTLVEWDEQALGAYWTGQPMGGTSLEGYYFYKIETRDRRQVTNPLYQPERRLSTLGARAVRPLGSGWSLTGELARQWGRQHPATDISAWGGYTYVRKKFDLPWKPTATAGFWGLSGDDPTTPANEAWDPLFSRWPKWSDGYIYSLTPETGVAYLTNLGMSQAELSVTPRPNLSLRGTYYYLWAWHPHPGNPLLFGDGTGRGHMLQARLDFSVGKTVKGHLEYETLLPGSFYRGNDPGWFLRFEVVATLRHAWPVPW
jgi:hypothetical protein